MQSTFAAGDVGGNPAVGMLAVYLRVGLEFGSETDKCSEILGCIEGTPSLRDHEKCFYSIA